MTQGDKTVPGLAAAITEARESWLLVDVGTPTAEAAASVPEEALAWLHLAVAYLRASIIGDLGEYYCRQSHLDLADLGFGADLARLGGAIGARRQAAEHYSRAAALKPNLAEAHYGLGRVEQLGLGRPVDREHALTAFDHCLQHPAHPATPPHAHLHANAHWESAWLLDQLGRTDAALAHYRQALSLLDTFGVHHIRVARFLRRLGLWDEAARHYVICAGYTHRYFPEFILPPLVPAPQATGPAEPDEVFTTPGRDRVFFHGGKYVLVPDELGRPSATALDELLGQLGDDGPGVERGGFLRRFPVLRNMKRRPRRAVQADTILDLVSG